MAESKANVCVSEECNGESDPRAIQSRLWMFAGLAPFGHIIRSTGGTFPSHLLQKSIKTRPCTAIGSILNLRNPQAKYLRHTSSAPYGNLMITANFALPRASEFQLLEGTRSPEGPSRTPPVTRSELQKNHKFLKGPKGSKKSQVFFGFKQPGFSFRPKKEEPCRSFSSHFFVFFGTPPLDYSNPQSIG